MGGQQSIPIWPPPVANKTTPNVQQSSTFLLNKIIPANRDQYNSSFINRSIGTILQDKVEILFNLLLVRNQLRPAFLLEGGNYTNFLEIADAIKILYPEFKSTVESRIDNVPHRIFFHIRNLTDRANKDHDQWIAENLGFYCQGLPNENQDRIVITYFLETKQKRQSIYAEICSLSSMSKDYFQDKLEKFNHVAHSVGWNVEIEITTLKGNILMDFINSIQENTLRQADLVELLELLDGYGITMFKHYIDQGSWTLENVAQDRKLLLFSILWAMNDPMSVYYPLSFQDAQILEDAQNVAFTQLNSNPIQQFQSLLGIPQVKALLLSQPDKFQELKQSMRNLFDGYLSSIDFMLN